MGLLQNWLDGSVQGHISLHLGMDGLPEIVSLAALVEASFLGYAPTLPIVYQQINQAGGWSQFKCGGTFRNDTGGDVAINAAWLVGSTPARSTLLAVVPMDVSPFIARGGGPFVIEFEFASFEIPGAS